MVHSTRTNGTLRQCEWLCAAGMRHIARIAQYVLLFDAALRAEETKLNEELRFARTHVKTY